MRILLTLSLLFLAGCSSGTVVHPDGGCAAGELCVQNAGCLPHCLPDGGCPQGTTCTTMSGCCTGTACMAISVQVCR